ncbi:MAG TPA: putative Ig domain-containing protein, partial [Verrucomicrobiae bacterium]|nr:putative Ig domain-containing protein [Verrucomicrobiae bacterium]
GTVLPAGGHLLVWADGDEAQNQPGASDLHAGFSLARDGEAIALFAPDGTLIDAITFGAQNTDVSEGRFPDGDAAIFPLSEPTPRAANVMVSDNHPPALAQIADRSVDEGGLVKFSVVASDVDVPAQALTFSLGPGAPAAASITPGTGLFLWQTTAADGPGIYPIEIIVTDNGIPNLSASRIVTVTVRGANSAPVLASLNSRTTDEGSLLTVTNAASDPDGAGQSLTFSLDPEAPEGVVIDPVTGVLAWTPSEAQGPGNYTFNVRVTDDGEPALSDATPLTVFVREVNAYPSLDFPGLQTVKAGQALSFTAEAMDADLPAQILTFELGEDAPPGAAVDSAIGLFTWTPDETQAGTNVMTLRVRDDGSPAGVSAKELTVVVVPSLVASIGQNGGQVTIGFTAIPGRTYRVEYRDRLEGAEWLPLGEDQVPDGESGMVVDAVVEGGQRFYRVVRLD